MFPTGEKVWKGLGGVALVDEMSLIVGFGVSKASTTASVLSPPPPGS